MARFDGAFYAPAAAAFVAANGRTAVASETAETQAACAALADALGPDHAATPALRKVATLRPSIARRFVSIAIAAVPEPPKRTRKPRAPKGGDK